ncbi:MAG: hypothetical protein RMM58_11855 [Chloroflexota bacterium]|nr:hypothetical protein [Dehalococcoidia bacterium]MDW8254560.1 hypothetical protein [Chloroflexota bacterium]
MSSDLLTRKRTSAPVRLTPSGVVVGAYLGSVALSLVIALGLSGGRFAYSLDDPYIHLELARSIARGHYGVNPGEVSSPASSALWPFLLAPFAALGVEEFVPLVAGIGFSAATARLVVAVVERALPGVSFRRRAGVVILALAIILATNLIGLALNGMETSLQVLLAGLALLGLLRERETGRVDGWLAPALILGPLVRYENLALTVPAVGYLLLRRQAMAALVTLGGVLLTLGAFTAFLLLLGQGPLPTSVLAKSGLAAGSGLHNWLADQLTTSLRAQPFVPGWMLILAISWLAGSADRPLIGWLLAAATLQIVAGRWGWMGRYEMYLMLPLYLVVTLVISPLLRPFVDRRPPLYLAAAVILTLVVTARTGVYPTLVTPPMMANVAHEHGTLHRIAVAYGRPVGVNDLGWVSYRNDAYVLDFWGLASREALTRRLVGGDWMDSLAERYGVQLVLIYDEWFPERPKSWIRVATIRPAIVRNHPVAVFARDAVTAAEARRLLADLAGTLGGVAIDFPPETAAR